MELSALQNQILNSSSKKTVVLSSAASGKSRLLTEKVRQILRAGVNPRDIAAITFTNMAAGELKSRLGEDYKEGLYVGTIHGLANYMLCRGGVDTSKVLKDEDFDRLFHLIKMNPNIVIHLKWILLDEAQDSDSNQFEFMFKMINPECFFVCGDPKQSIYQWKGSDPSLLINLANRSDVDLFHMNENFRNGTNILNYAKKIITPTGLDDLSMSKTGKSGVVTKASFNADLIVDKICEEDEFKNWAILTRTNQEIDVISQVLIRADVPFDTFKQGDLSKEELNTKMEQNTVKLLTIHSAKGLEWNNVIVIGARYYNNEERNTGYVAATRARNQLIWMSGPTKAFINSLYK